MKIALNTYSFRRELESNVFNLDKLWTIAEKLKHIEGIELLDRHIPGWPNGDIKKGIKQVIDQLESYNFDLIGLGPHLHMYKGNKRAINKEVASYKNWIDWAAENGVPMMRSQVGGVLKILGISMMKKGIKNVKSLLDQVLPYAEERDVQIGIETHWQFSSDPHFLQEITQFYKDCPALGIIFDWGNFHTTGDRFQALKIATEPQNHCYNHVKFYNFDENFQDHYSEEDERKCYDTMKIVKGFKDNSFENYFSIEYEGEQPTIEGVYKSVYGLKYAISEGKEKIDPNYDWNSLLD
jgi:sugar phosphate isomerase/epimerase